MSAALKPYPEYRASPANWLPKVPAHWDVVRNGRMFAERNETGFPDLPILEVSLRTGVRVRDMENGRKQQMSDRGKYKRAVEGDIAYNIMRMWQGAVGIAPCDGLVSPAYVVARPLDQVDARYYAYLFRTSDYMEEVDFASRGIVPDRNRLYWQYFKPLLSPLPPLEEQRRIADFLDAYTAQVHRLIAAKRRVIALWSEARLAKIAQILGGEATATSAQGDGSQWWSSVPSGWAVARFRSLIRTKSGDMIDGSEEVPEGIPIYGGNGIRGYATRANTTGPILLLGRVGAKCGCVHFVDGPLWASEHALRVYPKSDIDLRYLQLLLELTNLNQYAISTAQPLITGRIVGDKATLLAPRPIQARLAACASAEAAEVDGAIARLLREIDLLGDYRDSLISLVVTGRLDIRAADVSAFEGINSDDAAMLDENEPEYALDADD